jgi:hypothetical protein
VRKEGWAPNGVLNDVPLSSPYPCFGLHGLFDGRPGFWRQGGEQPIIGGFWRHSILSL